MNNITRVLLATFTIAFLYAPLSFSQQFFRLRADVTVKTKMHTGEQNLTVGQVFYDRNEKKILYNITFPEKELIVTADTVTFRIQDGKVVHRMFSPSLVEFSVFHLALSSNLPDYGLRKTQYEIEDVSKEGEMVITTWIPPSHLDEELGNILISVMDKRLFGVVFFGPDGQINRKQLFEDYFQKDGLVFPGRIVEISYTDGKESFQVMTFKNLILDELENNNMYSFSISGL